MKNRLPLHARLAIASSASITLVVVGLLAFTLWSDAEYERELGQRLNRDVARHLAEHAVPLNQDGVDKAELQGMLMHVMSVNPALEVYLLDGEGEVLAYDAPPGHVKAQRVATAPIQELLAGAELPVLGDDPRAPGQSATFSVWPVEFGGERLGYVYVIVGGEQWRSTAGPLRSSRRRWLFGAAALALLMVGIATSVFFAYRLTRPLRELRDSMRGKGRSPSPALLTSRDEFGLLAREYRDLSTRLNEQMDTLERVDRDRREFVASVSHDLRTPLASLQGYLELLEDDRSLSERARSDYLAVARRRVGHLSRLVDQLFELARLEAGDVPAVMESFDLAELVQDVLQGLRPNAAQVGVQLICRMPRQLPPVTGDIGLLERAIANLVENALKFTARGGEVRVRLIQRGASVALAVSDDGPGISRADLPKVFDRQFRGAGSRRAPGAGLGLAITRRVLEMHHSRVDVKSDEGQGATFSFVLGAA